MDIPSDNAHATDRPVDTESMVTQLNKNWKSKRALFFEDGSNFTVRGHQSGDGLDVGSDGCGQVESSDYAHGRDACVVDPDGAYANRSREDQKANFLNGVSNLEGVHMCHVHAHHSLDRVQELDTGPELGCGFVSSTNLRKRKANPNRVSRRASYFSDGSNFMWTEPGTPADVDEPACARSAERSTTLGTIAELAGPATNANINEPTNTCSPDGLMTLEPRAGFGCAVVPSANRRKRKATPDRVSRRAAFFSDASNFMPTETVTNVGVDGAAYARLANHSTTSVSVVSGRDVRPWKKRTRWGSSIVRPASKGLHGRFDPPCNACAEELLPSCGDGTELTTTEILFDGYRHADTLPDHTCISLDRGGKHSSEVVGGRCDTEVPCTDNLRTLDFHSVNRPLNITQGAQKIKSDASRSSRRSWYFSENTHFGSEFSSDFNGHTIPSESHCLQPNRTCRHCGAVKFQFEPPGFCCSSGQVTLARVDPPPLLRDLYSGTSEMSINFRKYIRIYNSSYAFTSLGVTVDEKLMQNYHGVYTFRIQGQVHHSLRSLVPRDGKPVALQLYFFDGDFELQHRLTFSQYLLPDTLRLLTTIMSDNPYAGFFKTLSDVTDLSELQVSLATNPNLDQRVYNTPTVSQVAAIWVENGSSENGFERQIILHGKDSCTYPICHNFGCYDSMQYPLLFPRGEVGWHPNIARGILSSVIPLTLTDTQSAISFLASEQTDVRQPSKRGRVSCREYYSFRFQMRENEVNLLLIAGRLFQQFAVDMYVKIETGRLQYLQHNQPRIRCDLYQGLADTFRIERPTGAHYGKRVILPASFIGGPRDMKRRYLDAMTLVRKFGKPDLFITFTCNPNWAEIQRELQPFELSQNRPDLTSRVFRAKLEELKTDLIKREFFGPVAAYVYVVEFQKRGLPHAHFLLVLKPGYKLLDAGKVDLIVCAELPDIRGYPRLHSLVKGHMMHGPCGSLNPKNVCMTRQGRCKNSYPKEYCDSTTFGEDAFPMYRRRRDNVTTTIRGKELNNQWVVPYNPVLLAKFDSHLNVEVCSSIKAVKYLYKYVYKGHDRVKFNVLDAEDPESRNEIREFQDARWISAPESLWRIYSFSLNEIDPAVYALQVHLPGMHMVSFREESNIGVVLVSDGSSKSMLTEYFRLNETNPSARALYYSEIPEHFVWQRTEKTWVTRKKGQVVGRLVVVSPTEGERYYLRMLLSHVKGARTYEELRTVGSCCCTTFRDACLEAGLVPDDNHYDLCFEEATMYAMPVQLRHLFVTVLMYCSLQNPRLLWLNYKEEMCSDYVHRGLPLALAEKAALSDLQQLLQQSGKDINDFGVLNERFEGGDSTAGRNCVHNEMDHHCLEDYLPMVNQLNSDQRIVYDDIVSAVEENRQALVFVDGPGGTGKSFLYKCLLAHVRSKGLTALAIASSGVAAGLLPGGKTAHNQFKIPLDVSPSMQCNVSKQSSLANLLINACVIIWDEAPMIHRFCIEAVDRLLRDLNDCDAPFGGQSVVFGGDFRQILPVVPGGGRSAILGAAFVHSYLWHVLVRYRLTINMRAQLDAEYAAFLLRVGDGTEIVDHENLMPFPFGLVLPFVNLCDSLDALVSAVYGDVALWGASSTLLGSRVILTPKNEDVDVINNTLIDTIPGEIKTYYSFDEPLCVTDKTFQPDFLNTLNVNGVPPHELRLKKNCLVLLMRNINCSAGLSNGTRLICTSFTPNLIECKFATTDRSGETVFLPRIPFVPIESQQNLYSFKRTQFPIRLCFAMTINKVQGQTLEFVGLYLREPVFSHGQLYVALSRVQNRQSIKILICSNIYSTSTVATKNIVFPEIFELCGHQELHQS